MGMVSKVTCILPLLLKLGRLKGTTGKAPLKVASRLMSSTCFTMPRFLKGLLNSSSNRESQPVKSQNCWAAFGGSDRGMSAAIQWLVSFPLYLFKSLKFRMIRMVEEHEMTLKGF